MPWTRWFSAAIVAGVLCVSIAPLRAEEEPAPAEPPKPPAEPAGDKDAGKPPWWGGKNLLYLEIGYGQSSLDTIVTSVPTEEGNFSRNDYDIDETTVGRLAVGWTLPDGRGQFLLSYDAIKEDGYTFDAVGEQARVLGSDESPLEPLPWWFVTIRDGNLSTVRTPPFWDPTVDDADGDGRPSLNEVHYPTTDVQVSAAVAKDLNNKLEFWDALYRREFGGRRIWGSWSAGGRYFSYGGSIPMAAWLLIAGNTAGAGYTDGVENRILSFRQDTSGFGPTGSLGVNFGFFRRRLVLYAGARVAYLISSLETGSGDFNTFIQGSGGELTPAPANLSFSVDKSVWQLQAEASAKLEVAPGLKLSVEYRHAGFEDAMVYPVSISIPDNLPQIPQGTLAVFGTRDFRVQTIVAGLSYQF